MAENIPPGEQTTDDQLGVLLRISVDKVIASGVEVVNQSRGEDDLLQFEKEEILTKQLKEKPHLFLEKYFHLLDGDCCEYFERRKNELDDFEQEDVVFYFVSKVHQKSREKSSSERKNLAVNNRRYRAMMKLMKETNFFTETQMRKRDPETYHSMIGQYLTNEQVETVLSEPVASLHCESRGKYEHLLDTLDDQLGLNGQTVGSNSTNENANDRKHGNDDFEEEFDSDSDGDDDNGGDDGNEKSIFEGDMCESAAELRKREFVRHMQHRFLSGQESSQYVDYSQIDNGLEGGDDAVEEEEERDREDKWFDED